ncbi:MAG: sortase [Clostridia bacterium]|nr:sortase [Clostridia bacterium]
MKDKNRKGRFLMIAGLLLVAAALFLTAKNLLEEKSAQQAAENVADVLHAVIPGYGESGSGAIVTDALGNAVETAVDAAGNPVQADGITPWPVDESGEPVPAVADVLQGRWIPWPTDALGRLCASAMDGSGMELEWPTDASGAPMPWPLGEDGLPLAEVTDALGKVYRWPEEAVGLRADPAGLEGFVLLPADAQGRLCSRAEDAVQYVVWPTDASGKLLPWLYTDGTLAAPWPLNRQGAVLTASMAQLRRREALRSLRLEARPIYERYPEMEMPTIEIDGNAYIGVLDIPSKGLSLPVMSQWSYSRLRIAPCRYSGSVYSGDIVIAGHNYARHFSPIKSLQAGDAVDFTDADGNVFHYEVAAVEILKSTAVEEMQAGDWDLTLFTCTYGGKSRCALRCRLIDSVPAKS